jgi:pSer/pThr/pTyr-binding forkhead associated (FHA) protein
MSTCPYCGAETRPGDNFCLSCGHRLLAPASSPQQAQPAMSESTVPAQEGWMQQFNNEGTVAAGSSTPWDEGNPVAVANHVEAPTNLGDFSTETGPTETGIAHPARFILRSDNGEVIQEFLLDKPEIRIGRAAGSDIVLSKDKLTSRHHALVQYEQNEYTLRDDGSSNGTFINGQQLEKDASHTLQDNDHVGIGEYELIFRAAEGANSQQVDLPDMPTINVPLSNANDFTYRTRVDENATEAANDDFGTNQPENGVTTPPQPETPPITPMPVFESPQAAPEPESNPAPIQQSAMPSATRSGSSADGNVTFNRLNNIPQPVLPDLSPMLAALSSLDGQVMSLQEQLNATQDAVRHHEEEIAKTTGQLRAGVRNVSDRMDNTIADVARTREALAWADLLQLMEDVMNNPRDIEYVTKLARKARELNKVFQMHQNVLNTLAECNSLLRSLLGEDK